MNQHPVVSVAQLTPAKAPLSDPYGRDQEAGGEVEVEDDVEGLEAFKHYEVSRVIQRRDRRQGRGKVITEYLVKWAGYPNHYNVWMPKEHLKADRLIEDFEAKRAKMEALRRGLSPKEDEEPRSLEPGELPDPPRKRGRPKGARSGIVRGEQGASALPRPRTRRLAVLRNQVDR